MSQFKHKNKQSLYFINKDRHLTPTMQLNSRILTLLHSGIAVNWLACSGLLYLSLKDKFSATIFNQNSI